MEKNTENKEDVGWFCGHNWYNSGKFFALGYIKIFGVINKIEGNKITVTDNSNQDKVIISDTATGIFSESGEISVAALKTGQGISVLGKNSKDNQLEAKTIQLVQ